METAVASKQEWSIRWWYTGAYTTAIGIIVCVIKGFADPMYIVPNQESYVLRTKTDGGDNDRGPDSGSAKHVH
eukprot:10864549-Lingulodinium_polyedra.AAC.1